jgi:hypothetical protein
MRACCVAALGFAFALIGAPGAHAELVARGVQQGTLALDAKGRPLVAYVRGTNLTIETRVAKGRWRAENAGAVTAGSRVMAFKIGSSGPVALVRSADARTLVLIRSRAVGWQRIRLAGSLPAGIQLGWPGLTLDGAGRPVVAFTHWNSDTLNSQLLLARVNPDGKVQTQRVTAEGFPQSFVAPPAAPVFVNGRVHVIESYGYFGVVGTIEWYPDGRTWTGLFIDFALGDFPLGPVFARARPGGTVYAAWTQSMQAFGAIPVTLAIRGRSLTSTAEFVLERALTTALALPASGPEIAANEWVGADELDLDGDGIVWAGTVVRGKSRVELDGSIVGLAAAPRGGRDLLLARAGGLQWFRSPRALTTHLRIATSDQPDGSVEVSGQLLDAKAGTVTLFRERLGAARAQVGRTRTTGGSFSFVDRSPVQPLLYRAVYTDPSTGIPYAALLRPRLSIPDDDDSSVGDSDADDSGPEDTSDGGDGGDDSGRLVTRTGARLLTRGT